MPMDEITQASVEEQSEKFDHYNILLASSSEMFKQALVVMMSAILNSGKPCHFYIMQSDWNSDLKNQCISFVSLHPDNEVHFIEMDDAKLKFLKPFKGKYGMYYKLFAHEYLPISVKRALYLDTDIMIRKNISDFYFDDFEDLYFIAINSLMEIHPQIKNKDFNPKLSELCLRKSTNSNPGVLLINIDKLRRENFNIEYYKNVVSQISDNYWYEEGILNYLFTYKRKYVPAYKWQTMIRFIDVYPKIFALDEKTRTEQYNEFYTEDFDEKNELAIIHFVLPRNGCKPWQTIYNDTKVYDKSGNRLSPIEEPFFSEWWKIAEKLPIDLFCQLIRDAKEFELNETIDQVKKVSTYRSNALNFCYEVFIDTLCDHKFERYMKSLSGRNVALLKHQDTAAKIFKNAADVYGINIILSSEKPDLNNLTPEEFSECKKADVIISCCVHGTKTHERDGVKCIDIWDILRDDSLTAALPTLQTIDSTSGDRFTADLKAASEQNAQLIKLISEYHADLVQTKQLTQKIEELQTDKDKLNVEIGKVSCENDLLKEKLQNEITSALNSAKQAKISVDEANQEIERLKHKISEMENSRSWRYTRIFRKNKKDEEI